MKKIILFSIIVLILLISLKLICLGDWHLKRNKNNKLPKGLLSQLDENTYLDEVNMKWILQPHSMNVFHQPDVIPEPVPPIPIPYPNVVPPLEYDSDFPNLKFLSLDGQGASYEAILQPNGRFLVNGKKQGTYNYANPEGIVGNIKHGFLDVIPHLFSAEYDDSQNQVN